MELQELANCLEKLGNPTRLEIFRLLVRAGKAGLPVGDLQAHLGIPASTLSHHILFLVTARLIQQEREGRVLRCKPNFELIRDVVAALTVECCSGVEPIAAARATAKGGRAGPKTAADSSTGGKRGKRQGEKGTAAARAR